MIIGTCSLCGGPVESPDHWSSILPPPIRCLHCGAEKPKHGPVIDMHRPTVPLPMPAPQFDVDKRVFGPATSGDAPPNLGQTVSKSVPL